VLHDVIGYIEVELNECERGKCPDRLAAKGKVALDVSDVAVVAVRRLLDDGVRISLEVLDEPPLARLGCRLDGVLPEPKRGDSYILHIP
jgi:hypothetical protein